MNRLSLIILLMVLTGCREVSLERVVGTIVSVELIQSKKVDDEYLFYSTYKDSMECVVGFTVGEGATTDTMDPAYCKVLSAGDQIDVIKITSTEPKIGINQVRTFYLIKHPDLSPERVERVIKVWGYPRKK